MKRVKKKGIKYQGRSHDVLENKGKSKRQFGWSHDVYQNNRLNFLGHDVYENKSAYQQGAQLVVGRRSQESQPAGAGSAGGSSAEGKSGGANGVVSGAGGKRIVPTAG